MTKTMNTKTFQILLLVLVSASPVFGQQAISQDEAIQIALKNNLMVKSGEYDVAYQKQMKRTAFDLGKTNVTWMRGQFNSILKDNNYTISQTIPFPTALSSQAKLANAQTQGAEIELTMTKNDLVKQVRSQYNQLVYLMALNKELILQDSLFSNFSNASQVRYRVGEGTLLEKTTAETQWMEIKNQLTQNESDIIISKRQLQTLLNTADEITPTDELKKNNPMENMPSLELNPELQLLKQEVVIADKMKRVEKNKMLPDITVGYFTQSLIGFQRINNNDVFFDKNDRFTGFELGLSIPLWFVPQQSKAKAATLQQESSQKKYEYFQNNLEGSLQSAQLELVKHQNSLRFYESNANTNADLILHQAQRGFDEGEIGYLEFLQAVNQVRNIKLKYLEVLNQHNQAVIELDYLNGKF